MNFLIIDGYSKQSRDDLASAGMQLAYDLFTRMLLQQIPDARYDILLPSDPGSSIPEGAALENYDGILWTGCNLTVYSGEPSVLDQIELARRAFEVGTPSYGSCWGLQIAVLAAGGLCKANPKGREMGIARKIRLTPAGRSHPMFEGRSEVFEAFISHDDEVSALPPGCDNLAANDFTAVQALAVKHKKGEFWAVQYHPEYDLHEMARLIVGREEKLTRLGFFKDHEALSRLIDRMEELHAQPGRKDLRWQLAIDDDTLSTPIRETEFRNWVQKQVLPRASKK